LAESLVNIHNVSLVSKYQICNVDIRILLMMLN